MEAQLAQQLCILCDKLVVFNKMWSTVGSVHSDLASYIASSLNLQGPGPRNIVPNGDMGGSVICQDATAA